LAYPSIAARWRYRSDVSSLERLLAENRTAADQDLIDAVRRLIRTVTIRPTDVRGGYTIEVQGDLAELTGSEALPKCAIRGGSVVAEARILQNPQRPPSFGPFPLGL
jgi:hypothetical protein